MALVSSFSPASSLSCSDKGPDHKAIVCPEHTVTRAEAISVFVAWARDNPQYLTEEPLEAVMRAAVAKWPCKPGDKTVSKNGQK
jgi:hypothetical protein